jgi:hypothetical protein
MQMLPPQAAGPLTASFNHSLPSSSQSFSFLSSQLISILVILLWPDFVFADSAASNRIGSNCVLCTLRLDGRLPPG